MRTMTWIDAQGVATVLDGSSGILLQANPVGLEAPNPTNTIDEYAVFDGGVLANRRHPVRSIALGLYLEHPTRVETVTAALAKMLQGPGELQWADDVHTRSLRQVIYEAGLQGSGDTTLLEATRVVSLLALDPFWYGPPQSQILAVGAATDRVDDWSGPCQYGSSAISETTSDRCSRLRSPLPSIPAS